jgi:hypothetical protein
MKFHELKELIGEALPSNYEDSLINELAGGDKELNKRFKKLAKTCIEKAGTRAHSIPKESASSLLPEKQKRKPLD